MKSDAGGSLISGGKPSIILSQKDLINTIEDGGASRHTNTVSLWWIQRATTDHKSVIEPGVLNE